MLFLIVNYMPHLMTYIRVRGNNLGSSLILIVPARFACLRSRQCPSAET